VGREHRFHHLDADWGQCLFVSNANETRSFDADNLDRLDGFIAELKKRGIHPESRQPPGGR
jgi:hypothetical protein